MYLLNYIAILNNANCCFIFLCESIDLVGIVLVAMNVSSNAFFSKQKQTLRSN